MGGEVGRVKADLPSYLWHLLQEVNRHPVGRVEVNPQTMERNEGVVGESAASFRSGGFVSIASNSLRNRYNLASEAGDLGHGQPESLASTPSI